MRSLSGKSTIRPQLRRISGVARGVVITMEEIRQADIASRLRRRKGFQTLARVCLFNLDFFAHITMLYAL